MGKVNAKEVMNGAYGVIRIDGVEYANISSFETKITNNREDIQFSGGLGTDSKLLSASGSGSATFKKINSRTIARNLPTLQTGKDFKMTLVLTVDDPDGLGKETVSISEVWTNDYDLIKFDIGAVMEDTMSFGFNPQNVKLIDKVTA